RHRCNRVLRPSTQLVPVQVREEEGPVLAFIQLGEIDRAAYASAEFVFVMDGRTGIEESAGIEDVIAEKFIQVAVKFVRSGLDDEALDAAAGIAELGRVAARQDRHLLDGIRRKSERARVALYFGDLRTHSIYLHFLRERLAAIDVGVEG